MEDKANGFSNGVTQSKFETNFDDMQTSGFGGFDDGFNSTFPSKTNDPFSANSNTQDPFGDKKSGNIGQADVSIQ